MKTELSLSVASIVRIGVSHFFDDLIQFFGTGIAVMKKLDLPGRLFFSLLDLMCFVGYILQMLFQNFIFGLELREFGFAIG
jgi:hypothetical protein